MSGGSRPLRPEEVAGALAATLAMVRAEIGGLPEAALRWQPAPTQEGAPGEWCVLEALGHLIEAEERGFAGRVRTILATDEEPVFATWDPPAVAQARGDCERDPAALLAEFAALREASVGLVAGLSEADLERGGMHPEVGRLRIGDLLHEWVHHDRNHLRQMLANGQEYAWPHMGNAQRFSAP
jgi:hypothetical protein